MNFDLNFYRGKRVLITGHTGFKGSWLALILSSYGANVLGFALPPEGEVNHFKLIGLEEKIINVFGDIRNYETLFETFNNFSPEIVFHLAAQAIVRKSYEDPMETYSTNIMGSVNLLEAVRNTPSVRSLVFITSDKCYENLEWTWGYRESDLLGGRDPYSASKAGAELVFSSYLRSYFSERNGFGAASTRAGNVIGGGDWAKDRIIPDCIRSIAENKPILLRNPNSTRPWQHVLEPLSGYLLLGKEIFNDPKRWSGSWNFGPDSREIRTVREVAKHMINKLGSGSIMVDHDLTNPHEAGLLQLNCDKAHQLLGWYPNWGVSKTLDVTADWYRSFTAGENMEAVSLNNISEYFGA